MEIRQLKKELGLKNKDLAEFFGLKEKAYYYSSSARKRYEESFIGIYEFLKWEGEKEKKKTYKHKLYLKLRIKHLWLTVWL